MSNIFADLGFVQEGVVGLNTGTVISPITTGVTLVGSSQATATTVLTTNCTIVTKGSVVALPIAPVGTEFKIVNIGTAVITPYPPVGFAISSQSTNTAGGTIAALTGAVAGVGKFVAIDSLGNYANS